MSDDGVIPRSGADVSMPKVVALQPGRVIKGQADPDIVEMLERFLGQARRGEIDGIAIALSRPNDVTGTAFWFGEAAHRLTAAVSMLNHNVVTHAVALQSGESAGGDHVG